jgi:hypothetical protein
LAGAAARNPSSRRRRGLALFAAVAAVAASLSLGGCGSHESPEAQVRATIAAGEDAVEARALSAAMKLVSPQFQDDNGNGVDDLRLQLQAYLLTHPSIKLVTKIDSIAFPYTDMARVRLSVGSLARDTGAERFDVGVDAETLTLEMQRGDDGWLVTRAERAR